MTATPVDTQPAAPLPHHAKRGQRGRWVGIPKRDDPVESNAPDLTSDSTARLFATWGSTRSVKSQIDVKLPPSSRARTIARHADSPTFFTALRPKRIFPSTTAKSIIDVFTSGGSTSIARSWHALT